MRPVDAIDTCRSSHASIIEAVSELTDANFGDPSELPGWTRAQVIAHVVNKARAHVWLFGGPPIGEIRRLYPPGHDQDAAAEAAAARPPAELRADLSDSLLCLERAWDDLDDTLWEREGIMTAGTRTMAEIVTHYLRNVEVHHVDLGIGYRPQDWPVFFIDIELPKRLAGLADRAQHAELLAWLLGRAAAPDLGPW